jgi:hypothetical protein
MARIEAVEIPREPTLAPPAPSLEQTARERERDRHACAHLAAEAARLRDRSRETPPLPQVPTPDQSPNAAAAVPLPSGTSTMARFLRGGGAVSWLEWSSLPQVARDALEAAGEIVSRERSNAIAQALVATPRDRDTKGDAMDRAGRLAIKVGGT